ncbi:MAG: hypothetical protein JSU94_09140 [Phycisphaerales bacterium]|nr:MAG: hypothetical protein JSU94_09140 [Phycisphaerales bacterium]
MKKVRTRTEWASLGLAQDNTVVVCTKSNGGASCTRFESIDQLKQAIDSKRIAAKKWAVTVPRSLCILKTVTLPASDPAEAANMIPFELPSLVPLSIDEIVYGCSVLNKQDNMMSLLVCILKLSTLDEHLAPLRAVGIEPRRITLDSLAIQNWFNNVGQLAPAPVISVLVDSGHYGIQMSVNGHFQGANEMTVPVGELENSAREIMQEILHQRDQLPEPHTQAVGVLLAGNEKYTSEIKNLLESAGTVAPSPLEVSILPNPNITRFAPTEDLKSGDGQSITEAVVATGLLDMALGSKLPYTNLLPQKYVRQYQKRTALFNHVLTASLSLAVILLIWLYLCALNWRIEKTCRIIQSKIAPIRDIAVSVDSKHQRVKAIQRQLSNRGQIARIVEELYKYTPKSVSINNLAFISEQNGAVITSKGQAEDLSAIFQYMEAVRDAKLLNKLDIPSTNQIKRGAKSIDTFTAKCNIQYE